MKKLMSLMMLVCACLLSQPMKAQTKEVTPDDAGYIVKVGDMAPDFEMELTNGQKVKIIRFTWQSSDASVHCQLVWCLPKGNAFYRKRYLVKSIKIMKRLLSYGVDRDEPLKTVVAFAKRTGVTYPLGPLSGG